MKKTVFLLALIMSLSMALQAVSAEPVPDEGQAEVAEEEAGAVAATHPHGENIVYIYNAVGMECIMVVQNRMKMIKQLGTSRELLWDEEMITEKESSSIDSDLLGFSNPTVSLECSSLVMMS